MQPMLTCAARVQDIRRAQQRSTAVIRHLGKQYNINTKYGGLVYHLSRLHHLRRLRPACYLHHQSLLEVSYSRRTP
jgi:hypothetical protein